MINLSKITTNYGPLMRNVVQLRWLQIIFCSCVNESFSRSCDRDDISLCFPKIYIKKQTRNHG